jgi:glutamyl-tRNA reductase
MMLLVVGCSFRITPLDLRERLSFDESTLRRALEEIDTRYDSEAVILSTCNRVELYTGRPVAGVSVDAELMGEFLCQFHDVPKERLQPYLYQHTDANAVRHLFRVVSSLDSMIVGEGQISGQVKQAYEVAQSCGTAGPLFHALFQHAARVAGRVRSETGIARGHVSVSSAAVDYVRQVFDHFEDKTVLVIGAGKMGELTLRNLRHLRPRRILVTNRSPDKAKAVAADCNGTPVAWEQLDDVLAEADIVLSTTGAPEPIVTQERFAKISARRKGAALVILDIAVPRDFDPRIHDGDRTSLFNIDDLKRIRDRTLQDRLKHVEPAEAIVEQEKRRFLNDWSRRRHGPVIARLTEEFEAKRRAILKQLLKRLDGRITEEERALIEGAFRLYQNQCLHGPISALTEEPQESGGHTLLEALRKLFRLQD